MRLTHTWQGYEQLTAFTWKKLKANIVERAVFDKTWVSMSNIFLHYSKVQVMEPAVPEPNDWATFFPRLPRLARPIHVAMPCCGIDGAGWALKSLGANYSSNNMYDLERRYDKYLKTHFENGRPPHLGPDDGDLLKVELSAWERPVHLLVAGPPCPPWAGNGNHKGAGDQRAAVFLNIVNVVGSLAKCGELQATVLENVGGILHKQRGETDSFMGKLVACLQAEIPEFLWDVSVLKAKDYCLPQDRTRVFLRGIRSSLCPNAQVPGVLPAFGSKTLREFLVAGMPPVNRATLTPCMKKNLKDAQAQVKDLLAKGQLSEDDLVCFPLDRADGKCYRRQVSKNKVPTLTTSNSYLFVSDMQLAKKDNERTFFRFLLPEERFTLQGFPACIASSFESQALQIKAAGNAYPVPLIGAAMAGLLGRLGNNDLPDTGKPLEDQRALRLRLEEAMFGKGGPKKKVTKRPACNAQKGNAKKENIAKQTSEEYAAGETIDQTVDHPNAH